MSLNEKGKVDNSVNRLKEEFRNASLDHKKKIMDDMKTAKDLMEVQDENKTSKYAINKYGSLLEMMKNELKQEKKG